MLACAVLLPSAVVAQDAGRFAYPLHVTAEQDKADPTVNARYTAAFNACQARAVMTADHDACFAAEFVRQDEALNRTWKATFARITGPDHARLLAAQRGWLVARDPFCRSDADGFAGGTIMPIIYTNCRVELTIRRTIWLEHLH
jgi:uncharacterized protein YecT (DUF1311 family)